MKGTRTTTALMKLIRTGEIQIKLLNLPCKIRAAHCHNEDGTWTVFLNARISDQAQRRSLWHELAHIHHRDLDSDLDTDLIESMRR